MISKIQSGPIINKPIIDSNDRNISQLQHTFSIKRTRKALPLEIIEKLKTALPLMKKVTLEAGKMATEYRKNGDIKYELKSDGSKVTKEERAIQRFILNQLLNKFSNFGIYAEEMLDGALTLKFNENINSPYKWVIDPIDGTSNFVRKDRDCFGPAIGLVYENEFVAVVFYAPEYKIDGEQGVFIEASELEDSVYLNGKKVFMDPSKEDFKNREILLDNYPALEPIALNTRNFIQSYLIKSSSLSLSLVSSGKEDKPVLLESKGSKIWDAVGFYLVEKAGGVVWNKNGNFIFPLTNKSFNPKTSTIEEHFFAGYPNAIRELLGR